jgi:hypothetical protein
MAGYEKEDIINLIQRIMTETDENRSSAMKLYDHMEKAMLANKGDLIVLSQMADNYLEQATRQTETLVKLAQVMQKLKEKDKDDKGGKSEEKTDYTALLQELDLMNKSPFIRKTKSKEVVTLSDLSVTAPPDQIIETPKVEPPKTTLNQGDIELETNL